ncbi:MAG: hypothetical protein QOF52_3254, partial [Propionibacteriaceae bacterium]|nr:hypothetical protein [Propionibacteriaceae bacterium]
QNIGEPHPDKTDITFFDGTQHELCLLVHNP